MAFAEQLLLFPETIDERVDRELREMRNQQDKMRKSLFAKHGELVKMMEKQQRELQEIKDILTQSRLF